MICLFILTVIFGEQKFVILMKSNSSICSFIDYAFGPKSKISLPNSGSQKFLSVFFENFIVLDITFRSMVFVELIFTLVLDINQSYYIIIYFASGNPIVLAPFIEKAILSLLIAFASMLKINVNIAYLYESISRLYYIPLIFIFKLITTLS